MESVNQLAHEYAYPRSKRLAAEREDDWFAFRVCWYRPTADVMPLWRRDVLELCDLMKTQRPALVATVREALATLSDEELMARLAACPTLSKMPDWDIYERNPYES